MASSVRLVPCMDDKKRIDIHFIIEGSCSLLHCNGLWLWHWCMTPGFQWVSLLCSDKTALSCQAQHAPSRAAIGSGGAYALAAARALMQIGDLTAAEIGNAFSCLLLAPFLFLLFAFDEPDMCVGPRSCKGHEHCRRCLHLYQP